MNSLIQALEKILFQLSGIEHSDLTKAEKNIKRIATEALTEYVNTTSAQAMKVLADNGDLLVSYAFFEKIYDLSVTHSDRGGNLVSHITYKDGSKAEYCDGDYTVKE